MIFIQPTTPLQNYPDPPSCSKKRAPTKSDHTNHPQPQERRRDTKQKSRPEGSDFENPLDPRQKKKNAEERHSQM